MNDDQWQAPGRERVSGDRPARDGAASAPVPPGVSIDGPNPYAPPSADHPYAPPSDPPYPPPSAADPYAPPSAADPYAPPSPADPYVPPSADPDGPARRVPPPAHVSYAGAFATSDKHRDRVLGGAGYDSPRYTNDKIAVTAMVLGIFGILVPGLGLLAVAFGHLALRRLRTSYEGGRGLAIAGLAMGYAMTAVWLGIGLLVLAERALP